MTEKVRLHAEVPDHLQGHRLDAVAAQLFPEFSRSRLQSWIKSGELCVDGQNARPRDKVSSGALIEVDALPEEQVAWKGQDLDLEVVFEDDSILVVNKPAGLVVHPAAGHAEGTLVNAVLAHAPHLSTLPRGGIVHRLDKDTSGIMVVAKSLMAHHHLVNQLQKRTVHREYCAICVGAMTGGGTVDAPIGRHPKQRKKMAVVATGGKEAVTHYRVAQRFGHHTRIAVNLETGRTHQIRVHMAHRHYPLVGDPAYGGRPRLPKAASEELAQALRGFPRQALHAQKLGLIHPQTQELVEFECALPQDIVGLIATLAQHDPFSNANAALY